MKTAHFFPLFVSLMLSTRVMAEPSQVTPEQAVERASQALTDMRGAIEKLKSPPDYASEAFVSAFTLAIAADEYVARNDATNAEGSRPGDLRV